MAKKHSPKIPDFSSHKKQIGKKAPTADSAHLPAPTPAPVSAPKMHMPKTSGHRGA